METDGLDARERRSSCNPFGYLFREHTPPRCSGAGSSATDPPFRPRSPVPPSRDESEVSEQARPVVTPLRTLR